MRGDTRGESSAMLVVGLVVALTVGGLITAFLLPIGIDSVNDPETVELDQSTGDGFVGVGNGIQSDLTETTAGTNATYNVTLNDDYQTVTVDEGQTETVTVAGTDVDVNLAEAGSGSATAEYTFPTTTGWSSGSAALWGILDVILVLAVFLFFIGIALKASGRV